MMERSHATQKAIEARRAHPGLGGQKHQGSPSTSDRLYDDDEAEFIHAMGEFIHSSGCHFPTWSDALAVLKSLGYHRREVISADEAHALIADPSAWERIEHGETVETPAGRLRKCVG